MKLEVGKTYVDRTGNSVTIHWFFEGTTYPYRSALCGEYTESGHYFNDGQESRYDLVAEVKTAERTDRKQLPTAKEEGGIKHDRGKPDYTLISRELLDELAAVREFGIKKYTRDNWKKGLSTRRSLAALLRHAFAFSEGEDLDSESGCSHMAAVVANAEHIIHTMKHHPSLDDRKDSK